jgi:hypothetical protein
LIRSSGADQAKFALAFAGLLAISMRDSGRCAENPATVDGRQGGRHVARMWYLNRGSTLYRPNTTASSPFQRSSHTKLDSRLNIWSQIWYKKNVVDLSSVVGVIG